MASENDKAHGSVLLIGGTRFQGRFLIPALLSYNFDITVFHRGNTPLAMAGVNEILGDRNSPRDIKRLSGEIEGKFDDIIDTCAYFPAQVRSLLTALGNKTGHYTLVSSSAVYENQQAENHEDSTIFAPITGEDDHLSPANYGALKVACETVAREFAPDSALIVRPVILIGPRDHTHRLYFWAKLIQALGYRLALEGGNNHVQLLDVRDYTGFLADAVKKGIDGIYNIAPPGRSLNELLDILADCLDIPQTGKRLVTHQELTELVSDTAEIPYFVPAGSEQFMANMAVNLGLKTRPLQKSVLEIVQADQLKDANKFRLQAVFDQLLGLGTGF